MQYVSASDWPMTIALLRFEVPELHGFLVRSLLGAMLKFQVQKHCQLSARNWTALEASAWLRATCTEWGQTKWRRGCITKWTAMVGTQSMSYCFCAPLPCMNCPKTFRIQYKSTQLRKSSSHLGIILNHWLGDIQLRRVLGLHARGRRFCIFSLAFFLRREWFQIEWLTPNWWIICFILCSWCWILNVYIVSCLLLETSIMS